MSHFCDRHPVGFEVPAVQRVSTPDPLSRGAKPEHHKHGVRYYCEEHRLIVEDLPVEQTLEGS